MEIETSSQTVVRRGSYNREVEWHLTEAASLMGERSNFPGLVAAIARGGSSGCSGTKGCGIIRIEPFENRGGEFFSEVHRDFRRAKLCSEAWEMLDRRTKWVLAARYCFSRDRLPAGLYAALGELSAVAIVCAAFTDEAQKDNPKRKSKLERLLSGAAKRNDLTWGIELAEKSLQEGHNAWATYRAIVETKRMENL